MRQRIKLVLVAMFTMTFAACHGPLLGIATETYVNQNDAKQILELTTKETVKGFITGRSPNPQGTYTLLNEQKVTTGRYTQVENTYILKSNENQEFKIALQQDS